MMCCLLRSKPAKKFKFYFENGTIIQAGSFSEAVKVLHTTGTKNMTMTKLRKDEMWLVTFSPDVCVLVEAPSTFRSVMAAEWLLHLDRRKAKLMKESRVQELERELAEAQLQMAETPAERSLEPLGPRGRPRGPARDQWVEVPRRMMTS